MGDWDFGLDADFNLLGGGGGSFGEMAPLAMPEFSMPDIPNNIGDAAVSVGGGYSGGADILGNYGGSTGMGGQGSGPYSPNQTIAGPGQMQGDSGSGLSLSGIASGFGDVAKNVLPAAQLGLAGMGLYSGYKGAQAAGDQSQLIRENQRRQGEFQTRQGEIAGQQQQMAQTAQGYADPVFRQGQDATARAAAGEVPPAVQSQIDEWARGAKQLAQSQAAKSGQGNSSQLTQWLSWIDRQAQSMKGSWIESQQKYGLNAAQTGGQILGTGAQALGGAANTASQGAQSANQAAQFASQQQNEIQNLIAQANQVLGRLNASATR